MQKMFKVKPISTTEGKGLKWPPAFLYLPKEVKKIHQKASEVLHQD